MTSMLQGSLFAAMQAPQTKGARMDSVPKCVRWVVYVMFICLVGLSAVSCLARKDKCDMAESR